MEVVIELRPSPAVLPLMKSLPAIGAEQVPTRSRVEGAGFSFALPVRPRDTRTEQIVCVKTTRTPHDPKEIDIEGKRSNGCETLGVR